MSSVSSMSGEQSKSYVLTIFSVLTVSGVSLVSEKFESGWLTVSGVSGVTLEFFKEVGEFLVWLVFC